MDVPPSRYRVIERDRRLVVIDTRASGRPATIAPAGGLATGWRPRRVRFDGTAELTTRAFYDAKGPRTVLLDPVTARWIERGYAAVLPAAILFAVLAWFVPVAMVPAAALLNPKLRARARDAIARWIDARTPD